MDNPAEESSSIIHGRPVRQANRSDWGIVILVVLTVVLLCSWKCISCLVSFTERAHGGAARSWIPLFVLGPAPGLLQATNQSPASKLYIQPNQQKNKWFVELFFTALARKGKSNRVRLSCRNLNNWASIIIMRVSGGNNRLFT